MKHHSQDAADEVVESAIELINVAKSYGGNAILKDINLNIRSGEFLALLGPSGCGKSTLLKLISGLEELSDGEIYIGGILANYIKPSHRGVAMVFQNYALYPHMTVRENLGFPLKISKHPRREIEAKVADAAALLQLDKYLDHFPDELSGGQRQRVALGRAIVREPLAFLMDEPLSNLDAILRIDMRTELVRMHKRVGRTTVYVTHDQTEAMTMADRIVLMDKGQIQQIGTPAQIYNEPANTFVAKFVGSPPMNVLQGCIIQTNDGQKFTGDIDFPLYEEFVGTPLGSDIYVGVRPEQINLVAAHSDGAIPSTVEIIERVGADLHVFLTTKSGARVTARAEASATFSEGQTVGLTFNQDSLSIFDNIGKRIER